MEGGVGVGGRQGNGWEVRVQWCGDYLSLVIVNCSGYL